MASMVPKLSEYKPGLVTALLSLLQSTLAVRGSLFLSLKQPEGCAFLIVQFLLFFSSFLRRWPSTFMPIYTPTTSSDPDWDSPKMELLYFSNEFPKDDLQDLLRRLHNHSKDKRHTALAQFINEATWAVKDEIRRLPTELKQLIPPFGTVLSWAENTELREGPICGAVDGVLLVVLQLATYIG